MNGGGENHRDEKAGADGDLPRAGSRSWWLLLLPVAFLLHIAEESWGGEGFLAWTARLVSSPVSASRYVVINAIAWPVFAMLTALGIVRSRLAWFPAALATMLVVNAVLHALGSLATAAYSPGLVTGLLLYVPLGIAALVQGHRVLRPVPFQLALVAGVLIHAAVILIAFV